MSTTIINEKEAMKLKKETQKGIWQGLKGGSGNDVIIL